MSFKQLFIAALFAATAIASPAGSPPGSAAVEARAETGNFVPGMCKIHIKEEADNNALEPMTHHDLEAEITGDDGKRFYKFDKENVKGRDKKGVEMKSTDLDKPIVLTAIDRAGDSKGNWKLQGWKIKFGGDMWSTKDTGEDGTEKRCDSGQQAGPQGEGGVFTRKYDCYFKC